MPFRLRKFWGALALLAAMWGVSRLPSPKERSWVRPVATGGRVRILTFHASVGILMRGEGATLCYGVENARTVRIAPAVARLFPSSNHCMPVVPQHTTHYTLLAEGFDGSVVTQSITLAVQPAPAERPQPYFVSALSPQNDQLHP